ncbi:hypothetical protein NM208_g2315 [Fusarium decemcellulare]|uniref:Uncharacterized protein n=1 Tax=Fusarium decemcellulare TaxID=57161 RepID=A0ACC1ST68_9HYPO|nr:hypothetical protein NM208_g2315 [Fusarium decemcellulare]
MNQQLGICTISMGWHSLATLEEKIKAVQSSGISGLELNMIDLDKFAKRHSKCRLDAAKDASILCKAAGIEVFALGPFEYFEGTPTPLSSRLDTAFEWMNVAHEFGCTVLQVPINFSNNAVGDEKVIVDDLRALAELGLQQKPPISIAYEALAWGLHVADWEESLRVVDLVDCPNFGLCIDTYHVLTRVWADPRTVSGVRPGAASALRDTIQRFRTTCPPEKIIYIQLSDGEKMSPPILPGHPVYRADEDSTYSWCLYGRVFPLEAEEGAYFPLEGILRAWLIESGWKGWVSMETFHRDMDQRTITPGAWAARAVKSWDRITRLLSDKN